MAKMYVGQIDERPEVALAARWIRPRVLLHDDVRVRRRVHRHLLEQLHMIDGVRRLRRHGCLRLMLHVSSVPTLIGTATISP